MSLTAGSRLGPYEIQSPLGEGGMGVVYRAVDTNLGRPVAIKVLPEEFAADADRLVRFEREARTLAALNHPHIAQIHGFERSGETRALVMELVEGPTLADRIAQGPLSIDEALPIARQIAEALEAAHEQGIIHRDLKPANIKVRPDGTVKVLDFGLAKAFEPAATLTGASISPTITSPAMTQMGVILGTAAYMSPEQARGKLVDRRADIWAFGVVLYEMLTGHRAFDGDDLSLTLASVLKADPDWSALPAETPSSLRRLLVRCVKKDSKDRLQWIGDARLEVSDLVTGGGELRAAPAPSDRPTRWMRVTMGIAALLIALLAYEWIAATRESASPDAYHVTLLPPPGANLATRDASVRLALSPDGRWVAFIGSDGLGQTQLWLRRLDSPSAQHVARSENATTPFWSPDSRHLGFFQGGQLKRVDVIGGAPIVICEARGVAGGATWQDDAILFSSGNGPIKRVAASGGMPANVTSLEGAEVQHAWPYWLPDGSRFLFTAIEPTSVTVFAGSLDAPERTPIPVDGGNVQYASGRLLFPRGSTLMAQPFDVQRLALSGDADVLAQNLALGGIGGMGAAFSVSAAGHLVYQTAGADVSTELVWIDRSGQRQGSLGSEADHHSPELSPDGTRVGVSILDPTRRQRDIWVYDTARGVRTRLTTDPADENALAWSPDSQRIAFSSRRRSGHDLYEKDASGSGMEELLLEDDLIKYPSDWSRNGRYLTYWTGTDASPTGNDIGLLDLSNRTPALLVQSPFSEMDARISPDGRWVAYMSGETGQREVYVDAFPAKGRKVRVSASGGDFPRWRDDGRELFYVTPDNVMMAASVDGRSSAFVVGEIRRLFGMGERRPSYLGNRDRWYDVTADGQRFIVNTLVDDTAPVPITLVVNWPALLAR